MFSTDTIAALRANHAARQPRLDPERSNALIGAYWDLVAATARASTPDDCRQIAADAIRPGSVDRDLYNFACHVFHAAR